MATKKQQLDAKLGSWTDQASLTRNQPTEPVAAALSEATDNPPVRAVYATERGLLDRVDACGTENRLTQKEVIGRLLTWALDQVDAGVYELSNSQWDPSRGGEKKN